MDFIILLLPIPSWLCRRHTVSSQATTWRLGINNWTTMWKSLPVLTHDYGWQNYSCQWKSAMFTEYVNFNHVQLSDMSPCNVAYMHTHHCFNHAAFAANLSDNPRSKQAPACALVSDRAIHVYPQLTSKPSTKGNPVRKSWTGPRNCKSVFMLQKIDRYPCLHTVDKVQNSCSCSVVWHRNMFPIFFFSAVLWSDQKPQTTMTYFQRNHIVTGIITVIWPK